MRAMPIRALALLLLAGCAAAPPQPVAQSFTTDDGTTIAYDVCGSGRTALVFVHGWACDRTFWRAQQQAFAADCTVVAVDLAGHGESTTPRTAFSIAGFGADVAALVRHLDLERVVLVGHSLGGPVCLAAAAGLAGRVRLVIGIECLHDVEQRLDAATIDGMLAAFERDCAGSLRGAVASGFPPGADPQLVQWVTGRALRTPPATVLGVPRGYVGLDQARLLERARVPVRCLNAAPYREGAPVTKIEQNRRHGDFDAVVVEGSGHFLMLDKPWLTTAQLRQWLLQFASD